MDQVSWVPEKVIAEITGVSVRHVNRIRNGYPVKNSAKGVKVKIIDMYLQKQIGIVVQSAKTHEVLDQPLYELEKKQRQERLNKKKTK